MDDSFEEAVKHGGGICLDLSHWEDNGYLKKLEGYKKLPKLLKRYKIGGNHVSAVNKEKKLYHNNFTNQDVYNYSNHYLEELSEMDYVKKYKNYLVDIISIELENSLKRQIEVKKYLEKILDL